MYTFARNPIISLDSNYSYQVIAIGPGPISRPENLDLFHKLRIFALFKSVKSQCEEICTSALINK